MQIKIVNKEIKQYNEYRYYLEITLSNCIDVLWEESYDEALKTKSFISMRSSGAPVVNNIKFIENKIITNNFPEYAEIDLKEFINELENFIEITNTIYQSKQTLINQQKQKEIEEEQTRIEKLKEMNKRLNF